MLHIHNWNSCLRACPWTETPNCKSRPEERRKLILRLHIIKLQLFWSTVYLDFVLSLPNGKTAYSQTNRYLYLAERALTLKSSRLPNNWRGRIPRVPTDTKQRLANVKKLHGNPTVQKKTLRALTSTRPAEYPYRPQAELHGQYMCAMLHWGVTMGFISVSWGNLKNYKSKRQICAQNFLYIGIEIYGLGDKLR